MAYSTEQAHEFSYARRLMGLVEQEGLCDFHDPDDYSRDCRLQIDLYRRWARFCGMDEQDINTCLVENQELPALYRQLVQALGRLEDGSPNEKDYSLIKEVDVVAEEYLGKCCYHAGRSLDDFTGTDVVDLSRQENLVAKVLITAMHEICERQGIHDFGEPKLEAA